MKTKTVKKVMRQIFEMPLRFHHMDIHTEMQEIFRRLDNLEKLVLLALEERGNKEDQKS